MPRANFGVSNAYGFKWGRYGPPPKLGKILGKMKKAEKIQGGYPKFSRGDRRKPLGVRTISFHNGSPPMPQKFLGGIEVKISAPKPFSKSLRQIFAF